MDLIARWSGPTRLELITTDHHGVPGATVVHVLRATDTGLDFLVDTRGEAGDHLNERPGAMLLGDLSGARMRADGRVRKLNDTVADAFFQSLSADERRAWWPGHTLDVGTKARPPWLLARRLVPHRWHWHLGAHKTVWIADGHGWSREP